VALLASTAYFLISPLADAQSELLARTRPTLYDVLIALFGGSAGIVASSRTGGGGNVVPGVAIATALMPPLCTAGFGLAHGDAWFFLGAMHLYLINALFICLATLVFVRIMGFDRVAIEERGGRRVHAAVAILTFVLVLPSVYTDTTWCVRHVFRRPRAVSSMKTCASATERSSTLTCDTAGQFRDHRNDPRCPDAGVAGGFVARPLC
jgi:uncharacterized membrane protein